MPEIKCMHCGAEGDVEIWRIDKGLVCPDCMHKTCETLASELKSANEAANLWSQRAETFNKTPKAIQEAGRKLATAGKHLAEMHKKQRMGFAVETELQFATEEGFEFALSQWRELVGE